MPDSTINLHAQLDLDAPIERLWPLLSDTDRVNRLMGFPAFERAEPETDLTQIVQGHYLGVPVTWREHPFEWIFEQWFQVERIFSPPLPITSLITGIRLSALPERRTHVAFWVQLEPRNIIGWVGAHIYIGRKMINDLLRIYRSFGILAQAAEQAPPPPRRQPTINRARLQFCLTRLGQFAIRPAIIERLSNHLSTSDDRDVLRMRPFALADQWGEPRLDVLRTFLYATRSGLLDLEWDVLCPNCRGPSVRAPTLSDLAQDAHCGYCNIRYDVNFDESVELRFSVSPDIREATDRQFCIGGPANSLHIVAQIALPAHTTKELQLRMERGVYRLRSRQRTSRGTIELIDGATATSTQISFDDDTITSTPPTLAPGMITLSLENHSDTSLLVVIERSAWSVQAVSAAYVTALDEFRQLFSSQVLAPGLGVSIRNLTFLFSDLKGSTMLYDTIGDSPAYARVREHFDVMREIIIRWHGALVKTIGDAVMAVFPSVEEAFEASLEIQREFVSGEIARGNPALRVKLGVHCGPCIAVNANDLLDYFGSTVNIAARVQNESQGGDVVITDEVLHDPGVQRALARESLTPEAFERELKGFSQAFTLHRLWPAAQPALALQHQHTS